MLKSDPLPSVGGGACITSLLVLMDCAQVKRGGGKLGPDRAPPPPPQQGHQWSGCSVRIRFQPRLPHSFHHLLSIVVPLAHLVSPACSACSLPEWLGLQPSGLYWVRRTSYSVVTPSTGAIASWLSVLRLKNPVGTGGRLGVNAIHATYTTGMGFASAHGA